VVGTFKIAHAGQKTATSSRASSGPAKPAPAQSTSVPHMLTQKPAKAVKAKSNEAEEDWKEF